MKEHPTVRPERESICLDGEWLGTGVLASDFDELARQTEATDVRTAIQVPFLQAAPGMNAWRLERTCSLPHHKGSIWLCLDAAMSAVRISVNGNYVGEHQGGYTPFELRIDEHTREGENHIRIDLLGEQVAFDNDALRLPVSVCSATLHGTPLEKWRKQTGLDTPPYRVGIWQSCRIELRPTRFIKRMKITPKPLEGVVQLRWWLSEMETASKAHWTWTLRSATDDTPVASGILNAEDLKQCGSFLEASISGEPLARWTPDSPILYNLELARMENGNCADALTERFGYRQFAVHGSDFYLNGERIILRGESDLLQNRGLQFANPFALETPQFWEVEHCRCYFRFLKQHLDINCLRIHGSIGHPAIFQAADEVGLLLENQSSVWSRGYGRYLTCLPTFLAAFERETEAWITRDWNHPSVVIWGVENEMVRIAPDREKAHLFSGMAASIRRWDDSRPLTFDGGAGALGDDAEIYHIHHEENYSPLLEHWLRDKPLVFGEFWIGSRGAEQRLTSGEEYFSNEDYLEKQWSLWKERIEPMRLAGASGVLPYNFSAQWIQDWSGFECHYHPEHKLEIREGLRVHPPSPQSATSPKANKRRARQWRHLLGRYCVCLDQPGRNLICDGSQPASLRLAARNDSDTLAQGRILLENPDGRIQAETPLTVPPASTGRVTVELAAEHLKVATLPLRLRWVDDSGSVLDATEETLYSINAPSCAPPLMQVHLLASSKTQPYVEALRGAGVTVRTHQPDHFEWENASGSVLLTDAESLKKLPAWESRAAKAQVSVFIVEISDTGSASFGLRSLCFDEALPYSWKFAPITGRDTKLAELLLPNLGTWEADEHSLREGINDPYWRPMASGQSVCNTVLLQPGMEVSPLMKQVHGVGAGMDMDSTIENREAGQRPQATQRFRSLMTGSRREYSLLAEVQNGTQRALLSTLSLGDRLNHDPAALRILLNGIRHLSAHLPTNDFPKASAFDRIEVFHNCGTLKDPALLSEIREGLILTEETTPANHLAIDGRSVFGSTKTSTLCEGRMHGPWLKLDSTADLHGGWLGLEVNHCFEVNGPFFPWEYQSRHPRFIGFLGLALLRKGTLEVYLIESLSDSEPLPHLDRLKWRLEDYQNGGIEVSLNDLGTLEAASLSSRTLSY